MTRYYCRGDICKINSKELRICCIYCMNHLWCGPDCKPWSCGKSIRKSDYYRRYYARIEAIKQKRGGAFPVRKCLSRKLAARPSRRVISKEEFRRRFWEDMHGNKNN